MKPKRLRVRRHHTNHAKKTSHQAVTSANPAENNAATEMSNPLDAQLKALQCYSQRMLCIDNKPVVKQRPRLVKRTKLINVTSPVIATVPTVESLENCLFGAPKPIQRTNPNNKLILRQSTSPDVAL